MILMPFYFSERRQGLPPRSARRSCHYFDFLAISPELASYAYRHVAGQYSSFRLQHYYTDISHDYAFGSLEGRLSPT